MRFLPTVQQQVISVRFNPRNLAYGHKKRARAFMDEQALRKRSFAVELRQHGVQPGSESVGGLFVLLPRAPESRSKALFADGLQQIVERMNLKRPQREFVVRGD